MHNDSSSYEVITSIRMPVEMRSRLEHVRLARAQRGLKLPRLRDLVLEALAMLVASETACSITARLSEPVR